MTVTFNDVLVCDVSSTEFEGKNYYKLLVYEKGSLYRISIPETSVSAFKKTIGTRICLDTEMSVFDGKSRFKLPDETENEQN